MVLNKCIKVIAVLIILSEIPIANFTLMDEFWFHTVTPFDCEEKLRSEEEASNVNSFISSENN